MKQIARPVDPTDPDLNDWPGTHRQRWTTIWFLAALFLVSLGLHALFLAYQVANEQAEHGQPFELSQFLTEWAASVMENLQSEWAQLFVQAFIITKLGERWFRAGTESELRRFAHLRDAINRVEQKIDTRQGGGDSK